MFEVPGVSERSPRKISIQNLAEIVEPRYEELMLLVQAELRRSGFEDLIAAGIVLTGGSSKVGGLIELAEEIFHVPVRVGVPQHVAGLTDVVQNPVYSTGVGLLLYGREHYGSIHAAKEESPGLLAIIKNWFQGNF
jgi:cell division protein FtsA